MENQRDFCNECGGEMGIPGLMDYNMKEIDEQYRSFRALDGIVGVYRIDDIK